MKLGRRGIVGLLLLVGVTLLLNAKPVAAGGDFTGPSISAERVPVEPPVDTPVNITVTAIDDYGLIAVNFTYSINGSAPISTRMHLSRGDYHNGTYLTTIPALPLNSSVSYYATATDTLGYAKNTTSFIYIVESDNSPPFPEVTPHIVFPPYSSVLIAGWDQVNFSTILIDYGTGIKNVTLESVINPKPPTNFTNPQSTPMNLTNGNRYRGEYRCFLPPQPNGAAIRFRVTAYDWAGNMLRTDEYYLSVVAPLSDPFWTFQIQIKSMDTTTVKANLTLFISGTFPYPPGMDSIPVFIDATYGELLTYSGISRIERVSSERFFYQSVFNIQVTPYGVRELYPFDRYQLNLTITLWLPWNVTENINRTSNRHDLSVVMDGSLFPQWNAPSSQTKVWTSSSRLFINVFFELSRQPSVVNFRILLPISTSFLLLGFTALLDARKRLNDRLFVYLTLFVFASGFSGIVSPNMSYSTFTMAELLVVSLFVSVVIFSIFSMVSTRANRTGNRDLSLALTWDFLAAYFSILATLSICTVQAFLGPHSLLTLNPFYALIIILSIASGFTLEAVINLVKAAKHYLEKALESISRALIIRIFCPRRTV